MLIQFMGRPRFAQLETSKHVQGELFTGRHADGMVKTTTRGHFYCAIANFRIKTSVSIRANPWLRKLSHGSSPANTDGLIS
jgi:hypothetical protein